MLKPSNFLNFLKKLKMNFITGVPDSLLKEFSYELEKDKKIKHIIATNEGSAVSLAIGNYLATGKLGVVYMQNSGLNNALNPLISISDPKVYGIPMILMIGWRGEIIRKKQIYDEPQHKKQGEITLQILKLLGIKYKLISEKTKKIEKILKDLNYQ